MSGLKYRRILLKLSGEALLGTQKFGINSETLDRITTEIKSLMDLNVQVAIVIGGGNMFRGITTQSKIISRVTADQMGILATVMNALAMRDAFELAGMPTRIMSAIPLPGMVEFFDRFKAIRHLNKKYVVIFAGGTGNPLVTTDSAASLRAIEIEANLLIKATNVDGVYSADPSKDKNAQRYKQLTYQEALQKQLAVMDVTAFAQCRDHHLKLRVFNFQKQGALLRIVQGEDEGTLVEN